MAEGSSRGYPSDSGDGWRLVLHEPDVVEVSAETAAQWSSSRRKKLKLPQVIPFDIIELDADDDDPDGVMIIGEKISNQKNKQALVHMDWPEHTTELQSGMSTNLAGPSVIPVIDAFSWNGLGGHHDNVAGPSAIPATNFYPWDGLGAYHGNNVAGPSAIPATNFYPWDGLGAYHGGALLPPFYSNEFVGAPGEDHSNKYYNYSTSLMESGSSFNSSANNYMDVPPGAGAVLPWGYMPSTEMPHQPSQTKVVNSEIDEKYKTFKQFDTVSDYSDNFYALTGQRNVHAVKKPSKAWVKRIQHDWKVLEKDLPEIIYVRVYEDRMDLLRAVIVGPAGTPYHDGLFFFDVYFPSRYPSKPPLVNYRSGGLRLNPNLYECGKVCLSLLNTWSGTGCEMWNPSNSTMLQVLVSIQALVLNSKPYFNEPGYAMHANTSQGEKQSMAYNEETFLLSCRTMLYSLRNPPKHFEDFIVGHFRNYGRKILKGCKSYMAGAQVGCLVGDGVQDVDEGDKSCSNNFKASLKPLFEDLLKEFTNIGVNCDEFRNPGDTKTEADTILKL
ncbi:probable ubiquitin-conjugating enzyme E2 26 isoform X1 [Miscanthus floridulus]|uniref:probable ubiquitin-conjugating enzyme E2 26 isoform X1 n=2 Tax=Miscanthus floridulus TaxID=154761 RepID=UPI0034582598